MWKKHYNKYILCNISFTLLRSQCRRSFVNSCLKVTDTGSVWCRWKLSLRDWTSSRLAVCFLCPLLRASVRTCECQGRLCSPCTFNVMFPWKNFLYHPLLFCENKNTSPWQQNDHSWVRSHVAVELCALSRDVWPLSFHGLRTSTKTQPSVHTAARLTGFKPQLWSFPLFVERFEDIYSAHTHTHTVSDEGRRTSAALPKARGSGS